MKTGSPLIAALLLAAFSAGAAEDDFSKAQAAYDNARYAEAALLYEGMLSNGISNVEVQYNLGNALFKNRDLPSAVFHYRRAQYSAPRDPDIRANLHFALSAAGAVETPPAFLGQLFSALSQPEWIMAAVGGYVLFTLMLILGMLIRPAKRALAKLSLVPAAAILVAGGGWWHWKQLASRPEAVVVKAGATALYGPVEGSTAYYKVPLAALVRQLGTNAKGWVEIEYDDKKGWLKDDYIKALYP